jgi:DnaJ-like protein
MLNRRTLQRINNRPKQMNRLPLLVIGAGSLALAALLYALFGSPMFALPALLVGTLAVLAAYRTQKARSITTLAYDNLSDKVKARFSEVQEACEALTSSEVIWRLKGGAEQWTSRNGDAAPPPPREPAQVGLLETPGIRANVPIWGIDAVEAKVFFFPEAVLIYRDERYEGASYESLKVSLSCARFYEKEAVPEDAEVLGHSSGRSRMPVVLYGLLEITLPRGLEVTLQVSNRDAAARFARAFGAQEAEKATVGSSYEEEHAEGSSTAFDALTVEERAKVVLACRTLGVRMDAPMSEVSAAYKQLARTYHPDKVVNLRAADKESSERRMKEINAAYTELRGLRRN